MTLKVAMDMDELSQDLQDEGDVLDAIVLNLDAEAWRQVTPFAGWTVHDEISHLAFFDEAARLSAADPRGFAGHLEEMLKGITSTGEFHAKALARGRSMSPAELLKWWRRERAALVQAIRGTDPKARVPWYGPSMSAKSLATARIMETWAHGQDIVDALGVHRPPSLRLKHIAHLGVVTFKWSYNAHELTVPDTEVRVELSNPSGELWTWGPTDAQDAVSGDAEDFCLVVVRRRHVADTHLQIRGPIATQWMSIAQAFAGPPEPCPPPGSFPKAPERAP